MSTLYLTFSPETKEIMRKWLYHVFADIYQFCFLFQLFLNENCEQKTKVLQ